MTEELLKRWDRLANEATPGPWYKCHHDICTKTSNGDYRTCNEKQCDGNIVILESPENMKFILAAREAVPELIARVRQLEAQLPDSVAQGFYHGKTIMEGKVEQLEKEADWLAENAGECPHMSGASPFCWRHCPMWIGPRDRSGCCEKTDMREAARRAVSND